MMWAAALDHRHGSGIICACRLGLQCMAGQIAVPDIEIAQRMRTELRHGKAAAMVQFEKPLADEAMSAIADRRDAHAIGVGGIFVETKTCAIATS